MTYENFEEYKEKVLKACKDLQATPEEMAFITDEIIKTGMKNNKKPTDLAFALLQ